MTGSLVLILTAALVGMTTNPSDYTVAIVDCACAPLERTSNAVLNFVNGALDFFASPIFLFSKVGTGFVELCKDVLSRTIHLVVHFFQICARCLESVLRCVLGLTVDFTMKIVNGLVRFDGIVAPLQTFNIMIRNCCLFAQRTFDYIFLDLIVQSYIGGCLLYFLEVCHFLLTLPFAIATKGTELLLFVLKYLIALPFKGFLGLVKYVLYSLLHPYVCVVYSSCTIGVFIILIPVLMHVYKVTDVRPLLRWLCAVAMKTDSRNRVLQILQRMASENREEGDAVTRESETGTENARPLNGRTLTGECVVCYQSDRLMKVLPCGHRTTCSKCLQVIEKINNRCPVCREHILFMV